MSVQVGCAKGWLGIGGSCFRYVWDHPESWISAESSCSQLGAHLAKLETPEQRVAVRKLASCTNEVHIGATARGRAKDDYVWVADGSAVQQSTDFIKDNFSGDGEECAMMGELSCVTHQHNPVTPIQCLPTTALRDS